MSYNSLEDWAMLPAYPAVPATHPLPPAEPGPALVSDDVAAVAAAAVAADAMQEERAQFQQTISQLQEKVEELESKLEAFHCTDVNALKRAHKALTQHVQALDIESRHIPNLITGLETSLLSPKYVATETGYIAAVSSAAWTVDRCLRLSRLPSPSKLLALAAVALAGWRLIRTASQRLASAMNRNRHTKAQLLADWKVVEDRIAILAEISKYQPQPAQSEASLP